MTAFELMLAGIGISIVVHPRGFWGDDGRWIKYERDFLGPSLHIGRVSLNLVSEWF